MSLEILIEDIHTLPRVPASAAAAYHDKCPIMVENVNTTMAAYPDINDIIGHTSIEMMHKNHSHHAAFMSMVFNVSNYEILAKTIPWVYRAYSAHNYSYKYFPLHLKQWILNVKEHLDQDASSEILEVYHWMLKNHETMIALSQEEVHLPFSIDEQWLERKEAFLSSLLDGDHQACLAIVKDSISSVPEVEQLYLQIIQPAMYEIGLMWEQDTISVAQEHLASAIVTRIMAVSCAQVTANNEAKGKAVVCSAANEFHEIGAWMISDFLEMAGWSVKYLGANTPMSDLINLLKTFKPDVLALSVSMSFNIVNTREIINTIKQETEFSTIKIMVGGRPFNETDGLWESIGADGCAANAEEAKALAEKWVSE